MSQTETSLLGQIAHVECLNESSDNNIQSMLAGRTVLESDCDEQLMCHFHLGHNEAVHLSGLRFTAPVGAAAPLKVRIYVNTPTLIFANADSMRPVEEVTLKWRVSAANPSLQEAFAQLTKARMHNANHIALLVVDNTTKGQDDVTILSGLDLLGGKSKSLGTTAAPQRG